MRHYLHIAYVEESLEQKHELAEVKIKIMGLLVLWIAENVVGVDQVQVFDHQRNHLQNVQDVLAVLLASGVKKHLEDVQKQLQAKVFENMQLLFRNDLTFGKSPIHVREKQLKERDNGGFLLVFRVHLKHLEKNKFRSLHEHVKVILENKVFLGKKRQQIDQLEQILLVVQILQNLQKQNEVETDEGTGDFAGQTVPAEPGLVEQPNVQRQRLQELLEDFEEEVLDEEGRGHVEQQQQALVVVDELVHVVRVEVVQFRNFEGLGVFG